MFILWSMNSVGIIRIALLIWCVERNISSFSQKLNTKGCDVISSTVCPVGVLTSAAPLSSYRQRLVSGLVETGLTGVELHAYAACVHMSSICFWGAGLAALYTQSPGARNVRLQSARTCYEEVLLLLRLLRVHPRAGGGCCTFLWQLVMVQKWCT